MDGGVVLFAGGFFWSGAFRVWGGWSLGLGLWLGFWVGFVLFFCFFFYLLGKLSVLFFHWFMVFFGAMSCCVWIVGFFCYFHVVSLLFGRWDMGLVFEIFASGVGEESGRFLRKRRFY